ncbi:T9SS type A sorting domain-containing protein [Winogradskyella sp.]|uniref:T9SS type A sorting domain-containing protein n=1 Tax=Winogradskyella sp. TaxID=1883156 RepID=UPI003AB475BF
MKNSVIILMLLVNFSIFGQCPPSGSIYLSTQEEVDNFIIDYPNCTSLQLVAIGDLGPIYQIFNLNGLMNLVSVDILRVMRLEASNLQGLSNLQTVGEFSIYDMPNLSSFEGLTSLETVTGPKFRVELCPSLLSLNGLESLNAFNGDEFSIRYNSSLNDSSGLDCYFFSEEFRNGVSNYNIQASLYQSIFDNCGIRLSDDDFNYTNFSFYPNPVHNILNIKSNYNVNNVGIFNTIGQKVFYEENLNTTEINVSNLKSGIYFLKLTDDENNSTIKKFIKE